MKIRIFGHVMLALSLLVAGLLPLLYIIGNNINPITLSLCISLVGTVGSLAIMLMKGTHKELHAYAKNRLQLGSLVFVGIVFAFMTLAFSYSAHFITASLMNVIYRSWPLFLILLAPLILRERISKWDISAVVVGFAGMATVLLASSQFSIPQAAIPYVFLVLLAAIADAFASGIQKRYHCELTSSLFVYNSVALLVIVPFALYSGAPIFPGTGSSALLAIIGLGLMQNIVMTFLFTAALRSVKTALAGSAFMIIPFITMVFDVLILHEAVEIGYIVIALSVVLGLMLQRLSPRAANYIPKSKGAVSLPTIYDVTSAFVTTENETMRRSMQGAGRVLAFYKHIAPEELQQHLDAVQSLQAKGNIILFTNKSGNNNNAGIDELEFIRETIGHGPDDMVVIGAGNPSALEAAFSELNALTADVHPKPGPDVS